MIPLSLPDLATAVAATGAAAGRRRDRMAVVADALHSPLTHGQFIRHPNDHPLDFWPTEEPHDLDPDLAPRLGMAMACGRHLPYGSVVNLRIGVCGEAYAFRGMVEWIEPQGWLFEVGLRFLTVSEAFQARMVEQICHIETYRRHLLRAGREVSREHAAAEWIARYAPLFPVP